jgi:hypothetical protein
MKFTVADEWQEYVTRLLEETPQEHRQELTGHEFHEVENEEPQLIAWVSYIDRKDVDALCYLEHIADGHQAEYRQQFGFHLGPDGTSLPINSEDKV